MSWGLGAIAACIVVWVIGIGWRLLDARREIKKSNSVEARAELSLSGRTEAIALEMADKYPDTVEPLVRWIDIAFEKGDFAEATKRADVLRSKFPKREEGFALGASALLRSGHRDDAEKLIDLGMKQIGGTAKMLVARANLAHHANDDEQAAERFATLRRHYPDEADGYIWGSEAAARVGQHDEAERLLRVAVEGPIQTNFDHCLGQYARYAHEREDWPEAVRRWAFYHERCPMQPAAYLGLSEALRQTGEWRAARQIMESAAIMFPKDERIPAEAHRVEARDRTLSANASEPNQAPHAGPPTAENMPEEMPNDRLDSVQPETASAAELTADTASSSEHAPGAEMPHETASDQTDASATLPKPAEAERAVQHAREIQEGGNWDAARAAWQDVAIVWPDRWEGPHGLAAALVRLGHDDDARATLEAAAERFPDSAALFHDIARLAERRADWPAAARAWHRFTELQPDIWWGHAERAAALRHQGAHAEAVAVLHIATQRFPDEPNLAGEYARHLDATDDVAERRAAWDNVIARFPDRWTGYRGKAALIALLDGTDASDRFVVEEAARFPRDLDALHDLARIAERRGLWPAAEQAWGDFISITQVNGWAFVGLANALREQGKIDAADAVLREAQTRLPEDRDIARAVAKTSRSADAPDQEFEANRELVMRFESLGGGGHGCEFGIFQRHYGAEPLSLLRWADVFQDRLSEALETEFAGIGEPEFTNLFVPEGGDPPEYWTTDKRYHMAMRSFVRVADVPLERMEKQVAQRMGYLRRKLIEDLKEGTKIFVYKNMKGNLTDAELDRLHAAVRRYGNNTLLYIRYEDSDHPNGTVLCDHPGLLVGYIDHFSHTADTDEYIGAATDSLLKICRKAYALFADGTPPTAPGSTTHNLGAEGLGAGSEPVDDPHAPGELALAARPLAKGQRRVNQNGIDQIRAMVEASDFANGAAALARYLNENDANYDVPLLIERIVFATRDLAWLRSVWTQIGYGDPLIEDKMSFVFGTLYEAFYQDPDAGFLLEWVLYQPERDAIRDTLPVGLANLIHLLSRDWSLEGIREAFRNHVAALSPSRMNPTCHLLLRPWFDLNEASGEYLSALGVNVMQLGQFDRRTHEMCFLLHGLYINRKLPDDLVANLSRDLEQSIRSSATDDGASEGLIRFVILADIVDRDFTKAWVRTIQLSLPDPLDLAKPSHVFARMVAQMNAPAIVSHDRMGSRPRVALQVSGQLRGFDQALPTWGRMGLGECDVTTFVHCWKRIGRKPVEAGGLDRDFPPAFAEAMAMLVRHRGMAFILERYRPVFDALRDNDAITPDALVSAFNPAAFEIEDDQESRFAHFSRQQKMFYGIKHAWTLANQSGREFDVHIRIRPDFAFEEDAEVTLAPFVSRALSESAIFADRGRYLHPPFFMGDQIAVANPTAIRPYMEVYDTVETAAQGAFFGMPSDWRMHETLALSTLYAGVPVEELKGIRTDRLKNPAPVSSEFIARVLSKIPGFPADDADRSLLATVT